VLCFVVLMNADEAAAKIERLHVQTIKTSSVANLSIRVYVLGGGNVRLRVFSCQQRSFMEITSRHMQLIKDIVDGYKFESNRKNQFPYQ
jgi:hypothetical protein